jgi:hypothetical protein
MLRCVHDGVTSIKPGPETTGSARVTSFTLLPASGRVYLGNTQGSLQCGMPGSNSETRGRFCGGVGSNIVVQYSVGPIVTLHGRITAREYVDRLGNHVRPMIQTLFPNNDADNVTIHTAGTVQSRFEEHEGELQHLPWPAQSPDLNITEPLWTVLETRVRNRFPLQHL